MSEKKIISTLTYESSLTDICELNSSFDKGVIRIAYPGVNRNGSSFTKEVLEKCSASLFNCPIACHYDRDTDSLGGHDMEVVSNDDGDISLVNLTTPVGCIPESSNIFWEEVEEADGAKREYICAEALLWKRQEAYKKIKEDGITAQSMEIAIKDGNVVDDVYQINDFEFTALVLLGVEPCFESSALTLFSQSDFKAEFSVMMDELKECLAEINTVKTPNKGDDDIEVQKFSTKGGGDELNKEIAELAEKYEVDLEKLEFSLEGMSMDEVETKLKEVSENYKLACHTQEELERAFAGETYVNRWGEQCQKYWVVDFDAELGEAYVRNREDGYTYGFPYSHNNDTIDVDFECGKKKKQVFVDYIEGEKEQPPFIYEISDALAEKVQNHDEIVAENESMKAEIETLNNSVTELLEYKAKVQQEKSQAERDAIFARFNELSGIDEFEELRKNNTELEVCILEEKCFAIKGKNTSAGIIPNKTPKLIVEHDEGNKQDEPYGGIFSLYGVKPEKN